jgi:hypothetical protein
MASVANNKPKRTDWKRLGTAVQSARLRAGWDDMADWVDAVGRSSRVLLGLERGETTGAGTLRRIEELLHWRPGYADVILTDESADLAPGLARAVEKGVAPPSGPRSLDEYTTEQLLDEVSLRYASLALELHNLSDRPVMVRRQDGPDEVWEPMSPAQRREAGSGDV